ncbi:MAG TPA: vanadium-dependent haloperoxidase [Dehalococcoidia bacterium]|nr:vanadium-dependent haloperoxidase [Dehalococcoidia bacterium]
MAIAVAAGLAVSLATPAEEMKRASAAGPDTFVTSWDMVTSQAFTASGLTPAEGFPIFAYMSIAVYDSVVSIEGGYEPFLVDIKAPGGASAQAAAAAAANHILLHYLPQQSSIVAPAYSASLAGIADGPAKAAGIAHGKDVAAALISTRATDGFRAPASYTAPNPAIAGAWIPTGPTPIGPYSGKMKPFAIGSAAQLRPAGPAALPGEEWVREYEEVRQVGSQSSTMRTAEQTIAARFWAEAPVQQIRGAYRKLITDLQLDIVDAARLMAMASVSQVDAFIACFDAKYHYAYWRPITAIRAGDTDGNAATIGDPGWTPLLPATPNHPEYPSAHSCITPAAAGAISAFLGTTAISFTIPSLTGLGDRYYAQTVDLSREVANARIWGGIHFRSAVEDGLIIGMQVASNVTANHFQPVR